MGSESRSPQYVLAERNDMSSKSWSRLEPLMPPEVEGIDKRSASAQFESEGVLEFAEEDLEGFWEFLKTDVASEPWSTLESLLPPEVDGNNMSAKSLSGVGPLLPLEAEEIDVRTKLFGERFVLQQNLSEPRSTLESLLPPEVEEIDEKTIIFKELWEPSSESRSTLESLLPPEVEGNDMSAKSLRINPEKFPALTKRRDAEHVSCTLRRLLRTPKCKQCKVNDYYKKQDRQLEGFTEVETMCERGRAPGNPAEDEMKQRERMAILVTNIADIVLFALKVFASIESKSLSIIASILDPFFDLLWGFILWLTSHAMQNPNPYKYPIGKKRMQPVGMIVFGSFGLQLLFLAAKQFITKSEPEKDPQKEKWMIGVMTSVTMVQFMLAFYCRRFKNKIVRAYAEHHSSNVKTNLISLAAAVLAIRYYWWIDPTGAIIILLYTMNTWKKTFFENLSALIGRTAPPEFLAKLTYLIWNHHEDIEHIDTVRAYTFSSDQYFVEVGIVLRQYRSQSPMHAIGETLQVKLEQLPEVARAFVHIDSEYTHRAEHKTMV